MNPGKFDKWIKILKLNETTDNYALFYECFASVNKASGHSYFENQAEQTATSLIFEIRYMEQLRDMEFDFESYRIEFMNHVFSVNNVDNMFFKDEKLRILGELLHE